MVESIAIVNSRQDSSMEHAAKYKDGTATNASQEPSFAAKVWNKLGLNVGMLLLMAKYLHIYRGSKETAKYRLGGLFLQPLQ